MFNIYEDVFQLLNLVTQIGGKCCQTISPPLLRAKTTSICRPEQVDVQSKLGPHFFSYENFGFRKYFLQNYGFTKYNGGGGGHVSSLQNRRR